MDFKVGKTCSGCDRIIKNLKKISNDQVVDKIEDSLESNGTNKGDVAAFLKKTADDAEKTSKQLVKKMNENAKIKKSRK